MANKRALIVDDSTTAQYRLKKMLRPYPLDIDVVDSGEAALRYLSRHVPDVVFMDHMMPGMDGLRALQIIKSHPETALVPVIMYTSKSGDVYTGQARALGALDVVSKDTISAADLSKVMKSIHINPQNMEGESPELVAAANKVTQLPTQHIERRTSGQIIEEQTRNIELRLGKLEHLLEDTRRFVTARIMRELQNLGQSLRREMKGLSQESADAPQISESDPSGKLPILSIVNTVFIVLLFILMIIFIVQIRQNSKNDAQRQIDINEVLKTLSVKQKVGQTTLSTKTQKGGALDYLIDVVWTFNQNAFLGFHENNIDAKTIVQLHQLLDRITNNGFKGEAIVNIYVGNFCVAIQNNSGVARLASSEVTLDNCIFSSELYTLERVMEEYAHQTKIVLSKFAKTADSPIKISVNTYKGTEEYPERLPSVNAEKWNQVAQNNNRIELILLPSE